jgi:hypothetical protein
MARRKKKPVVSPLVKPAIVGVVALLGVMMFVGLRANDPADLSAVPDADLPIERRVNQTQDYARGDDQLRTMLMP